MGSMLGQVCLRDPQELVRRYKWDSPKGLPLHLLDLSNIYKVPNSYKQ
jgi:hypothetical protein